MKDKQTLGSFIKEKRIEKKYTQKQLADILFVTESAVSKWERGIAYPDITLITEICNALEITEHELINANNDTNFRNLHQEALKYNKIKQTIFWILNICYIVAIITCFIVNIAVNHTLSWFFIVLTSIVCAYSFCPTITWIVKRFKLLVFIGSTFVSLFLLLLTCNIYSKNYWFLIPTVAILLSYFIIFFPILFTKQKNFLKLEQYKNLSRFFLIFYCLGITTFTILLLTVIRIYTVFSLSFAISITLLFFSIPLLYGVFKMININKRIIKITTLVLISLIILFITLSFVRTWYVHTTKSTKTSVIEESFNSIIINTDTIDINIYLSNDESSKISYTTTDTYNIDFSVNNNTLEINQYDNKKIYELLFNFSNLKLDLYLNIQTLDDLTIINSTGDINIADELNFDNINITSSTGDTLINNVTCNYLIYKGSTCDVKLENSNINNDLNIKTSTGEIILSNVVSNNAFFTSSTGDIILTNVLVDQSLNILGSTTDVIFNEIDASNITVKLSTGNVEGVINTDKIFIVQTSSGKIKIPECTTGGICKITTSTGDITIKIKA
jgi:transcriptional regulator with XRE-family HTH domain